MRLTTLEIKGFKSFADKTVIHFNDNITGVVGPNGCGKSNVVDAIRWVLGEQKTSMLRLEKMDNLIFNGTKKRKASGLAEVSLTFENTKNVLPTEFKTVTITRKLFRNGDSEYRLNDIPCRLKDISNLFLDTGVSSDSYAIIELGMVDEILNDRDHSRRRLFEQASGISKYKKRKKETLNKLKGTEGDLDRVEDLLFEIEGNLKSLESQARKAKRYYKLKDDYKEHSINLAKLNFSEYKNEYNSLENSEKDQEDKKIELEKKIKAKEAELEKAKLDNLQKEKALSAIQKKLNELVGGVSSKENERNLLREQIRFEREKNDSAQKELVEIQQSIKSLGDQIQHLESTIYGQEKVVTEKQQKVEELKSVLEAVRSKHDSLKETLDSQKQHFREVETRYHEIEKKLAINNTAKDRYESDLFLFQEENESKSTELKQLKKEFDHIGKEKKDLEEKLNSLVESERKWEEKKQDLERRIMNTKDEFNRKNRVLDARQNEYNLTKSLVDNLEGFPESIKFLKKNQSWAKNAPLLSDIIYCPEEYRIAIENYLENYLNYYIVQNNTEALKAINLLSDAAKGKANFFVIDELRHFKPTQPALHSSLKSALDIIEIEDKYKPLVAFLLDNTYFAAEEDIETLMSEKALKDLTLLTRSGKYIRNRFSVTGGAVGLFEGKRIGRAKNLEKLQKEIKALEKESSKLGQNVLKLQDQLDDMQGKSNAEELSAVRTNLNSCIHTFSSVEAKLESTESFVSNNKLKSKNTKEALKQIETENKAMSKEQKDLTEERTSLREKLGEDDAIFIAMTDELNLCSTRFNEANIGFHQEKNQLDSKTQEQRFLNTQLEEAEKKIVDRKHTIEQSGKNIETSTLKLKELESDLLSGYSNKEQIEQEVEASEQAFYSSRADINELETQLKELHYSKQQNDTLTTGIKDKFNALKLELNSLKERLSIEFNVNLNDLIKEEIPEGLDREALESQVVKLKHRLDNFGEINPMAVEAYDEMKKRHDFIVGQKQDLLDAKVSLLTTIKEIEDTAKEKFMEAFTLVRENFKKVFRTLFTEDDKCDLVLLDESDPLESKIDIIAKPKGKRPQIIDQLSGGEKTLTATALLFSLYLLKPAPFCVFDEVDAPLDDTNIDKFNKIIQEFSKDSQFIIVTHNKQTMSHVDVIYGVTMQEAGVSKVVPVDFRSLKSA